MWAACTPSSAIRRCGSWDRATLNTSWPWRSPGTREERTRNMSRELFGTDGIRGVAGEYPLDGRTVAAVGAAVGRWIAAGASGQPGTVVIGMDTRESGPWIAAEIAGGLEA